MNHQSKAETPSGVIAAFAGCGLMRQANFYPEGIAMKFVDQPNVLPEVKEKAKRHIEAVNAWLDGMSGTMVCVKTIHAGQTRPYGPSVYESVIYCLQPNCNTVGAPLPSLGVFWVGECTPPTQPEHYFDASDWLETVSCQDEYCGDYAEGWDIATKEQRRELDEEVQKVMAAWLDRHDLRPKFFVVHDPIKYIVVDGVAEPEPVKETP